MLAVEPGAGHGGNEELRAVGVWASVRHGQLPRLGVSQLEVLIREFFAVNTLAASSVTASKVAALEHKLGNHAMESGTLVAEPLLAGAEGAEVLGALGGDLSLEAHHDTAGLDAADGHIKEYTSRLGHCF